MRIGHTASNSIAFAVATACLLINEGVFSRYEAITPQINRIYIYRDGCPKSPEATRVSASTIADISARNYFSRFVAGTVDLNPDGLLSGCNGFTIDLTDLKHAEVLSVSALSFPRRLPSSGSLTREELEQLSGPVLTRLNFSQVGPSRYRVEPPIDMEISTLKVGMSRIVKRLGPSEFGSYQRYHERSHRTA